MISLLIQSAHRSAFYIGYNVIDLPIRGSQPADSKDPHEYETRVQRPSMKFQPVWFQKSIKKHVTRHLIVTTPDEKHTQQNMADEGDIPQEVPRSEDYAAEPENVLRGHKATISNPQTSDKAKEHSKKVLESYDEPYDASQASHDTTEQREKDPGNVARGLKASISNPGVSEEAKENAKKKLGQLGQ